MKTDYDVVVIGSGFGGAVTAYDLAKKGCKVCILERGPQWRGKDFPCNSENYVENMKDLLEHVRILGLEGSSFLDDITKFFGLKPKDKLIYYKRGQKGLKQGVHTVTANGVGGGSLIYANALHEVKYRQVFEGWPQPKEGGDWLSILGSLYPDIKEEIGVHKARVPREPEERACHDKTKALKEAWKRTGQKGRFEMLDLAIQPMHYNKDKLPPNIWTNDPRSCSDCHELKSDRGDCAETLRENRCMSCGRCVFGCHRENKHTLDLRYIKWAIEEYGAHLYPRHEVSIIKPINEGDYNYKVFCEEQKRVFKTKVVVVTAGVLGSTSLLLRCKNGYRGHEVTLDNLSDKLGERFSGNGDFQAFVFDIPKEIPVNSTIGPTITSEIDLNPDGLPIIIEEGGVPKPIAKLVGLNAFQKIHKKGLKALRELNEDITGSTLMFLCIGRDNAYGKMVLTNDGEDVDIIYDEDNWEKLADYVSKLEPRLKEIARVLTGDDKNYHANPIWEMYPEGFKKIATVHPLGGCPMGESKDQGVVDDQGKVFGYENLYVADGSIIPTALGANPSLTIAALARRIAKGITI